MRLSFKSLSLALPMGALVTTLSLAYSQYLHLGIIESGYGFGFPLYFYTRFHPDLWNGYVYNFYFLNALVDILFWSAVIWFVIYTVVGLLHNRKQSKIYETLSGIERHQAIKFIAISSVTGGIITILSSFYNSLFYAIGLGNGYAYGLPFGYSVLRTNELMDNQLFHYFNFFYVLLDFPFWALITFIIVSGIQQIRNEYGKKKREPVTAFPLRKSL